ncbi:hypothetical protein L1280_000348 [Deinococcus sp. HSC-46F16]|uniref:hypothetical protein n=1 Tax=Deinococcus sp. HSC-46F16 TaxID=2910968 RepID=UPI00209F8962|nr:hypothetical protein [Deinococcus sp. HSC-46F16]MCP2013220.1 hypothetical protein [Deinococcus sp. HSC-46F16]
MNTPNPTQRQRLERRRARLQDRQDRLYQLLIRSRAPVLPAKRLASFMAVSEELLDVERQIARLSGSAEQNPAP